MIWVKLFLKSIVLPPGIFFLAVLGGYLFRLCKKKRLGESLIFFSILAFYLISTPQGAFFFSSPLQEKITPFTEKGDAQAIVILGGGQRREASEFSGQDTANSSTLVRLAYGAFLFRKTALPILVSGGIVYDDRLSEASVMKNVLEEVFSIPTKWLEDKSQNTLENAQMSSELLKQAGIKKIILVTEAWHMRRALLAFSNLGLEVVAAPTNFIESPTNGPSIPWLPNAKSLALSSRALHEWLGYIWYRLIIP